MRKLCLIAVVVRLELTNEAPAAVNWWANDTSQIKWDETQSHSIHTHALLYSRDDTHFTQIK